MDVAPILATLKRNKTGAVLAVIQIALTLAIISNVLSIIGGRAALMMRPTGIDEPDIFAIGFLLPQSVESLSMLQTDLRSLRATPGVVDAVAANTYPLRGSGWREGISHQPDATSAREQSADTAVYAMDRHALDTLGLKLVAGRNFAPDEAIQGAFNGPPMASVAIISRSLQRQLFPHGDALGQVIYVSSDPRKPVTVVGVVQRLQSPTAAATLDPSRSENSLIVPIRNIDAQYGLFLVRVKPGSMDATMAAAKAALAKANPNRIFGRLRPFEEIRGSAYSKDRAMAIALAVVCLILVIITALGIVGLTSFWVTRRRRQIGIRRALGATRAAIVKYFLIENAILCASGAVLGAIVSHSLNAWLSTHYGVGRLPAVELLVGAIIVVLLGQGAAMLPALRAARIAPTEALRSL